jgi:hypothetical protein
MEVRGAEKDLLDLYSDGAVVFGFGVTASREGERFHEDTSQSSAAPGIVVSCGRS